MPTLVIILNNIPILQMRRTQQGGISDQARTIRGGAAGICLMPQTKLSVAVLGSREELNE